MGTTIIKNREFRKIDNPKGKKKTLDHPRIGNTSVLFWNLSISKFVGQYQHTLKLPFMKSYIVYKSIMAIEKVIYLKVSREKHIIWVRALKNWRLPTQLIIFP